MLNCSKCGKSDIQEISRCQLIKTGLCQYRTQLRFFNKDTKQAWLILLLAILFLFCLTIFPISTPSFSHGSALWGIFWAILLGLFLFAGIAAIIFSFANIFARQLISVSLSNGQAYIEKKLWSQTYYTQVTTLTNALEFKVAAQKLNLPASTLLLQDISDLAELKRAPDKYKQVAINAFIAALFDLLNRGLIKAQLAEIYESQAQQLDHTFERQAILFLDAESSQKPALGLGLLEQEILSIINNWTAQTNFSNSPLAPRAQDILEALAKDNTTSSDAIFALLSKDEINYQSNFNVAIQIKDNEILRYLYSENAFIYTTVDQDLAATKTSNASNHNIENTKILGSPRFIKLVRNSLIVGIILLLTSGRILLGVDFFTLVATRFVKDKDLKQHTQEIVDSSTNSARNKFWDSIAWLDRQLASLERLIYYFRSNNSQQQLQYNIQKLKNLITKGDLASRRQAAYLLSTVDQEADELVNLFRTLLKDADQETRQAALQALSQFDQLGMELIPELVDLLDADEVTATLSAEHLVQLSEQKSLDIEKDIHAALKGKKININSSAKKILAELGF